MPYQSITHACLCLFYTHSALLSIFLLLCFSTFIVQIFQTCYLKYQFLATIDSGWARVLCQQVAHLDGFFCCFLPGRECRIDIMGSVKAETDTASEENITLHWVIPQRSIMYALFPPYFLEHTVQYVTMLGTLVGKWKRASEDRDRDMCVLFSPSFLLHTTWYDTRYHR